MKGGTAVLSATVLVPTPLIQPSLVLVRIQYACTARVMRVNCLSFMCFVCVHVVQLPRITHQLKESQGKFVKCTIQAIGTNPLNYQWQWKPVWQPCPAEWSDGATLTIPSVQRSNEGSYCCVISNCAGSQASNSVNLSIGKNPTINVSTS